MIKRLKNRQAQTNLTEYVIVVFIVVAMMTAMGTSIKRGLQGRIYDARNYGYNVIKERSKGSYSGKVLYAYEPYYTEAISQIQSKDLTIDRLYTEGISKKEFNSEVFMFSNSLTAPPKDAD